MNAIYREYGGGWSISSRYAYTAKIKRMNAKELKEEISLLKSKMVNLDVRLPETHLLQQRTMAAYRLSSVNKYLEGLLKFL